MLIAPLSENLLLALGLLIGLAFGVLARHTRFCFRGALADAIQEGRPERFAMLVLAGATAIVGTTLLQLAGWVDATRSLYAAPQLPWLAHLAGGLCFGLGMVLASGCVARSLVHLGGGNLRALVVLLVVAVSAYMTLGGVLSIPRRALTESWVIDFGAAQDLPSLLAAATGLARPHALLLLVAGIAALGITVALRFQDLLDPRVWAAGLGVGLLVPISWVVSGHLGYLPEDPVTLAERYLATDSGRPEALSFVGPTAHLLELLLLWTDDTRHLSWGVATALGVLGGAALHALARREFRWQGYEHTHQLARQLVGGLLMGFGGVTALGCSIGQGLSGLSTLSLGSLLAVAGIAAGGWLALRHDRRRAAEGCARPAAAHCD